MPLTFEVTKFKDKYQIKNTGDLTITVKPTLLGEDCATYEQVIADITVTVGETKTVSLLSDGEYKIDIVDGIEASYFKVLHYLSLEKGIIADMQYILCDCEDDPECVECKNEHCSKHLSTILKIFSYQRLTHPRHAAFLETVFQALKCSVNDLTLNIVLEEQTSGTAEYLTLMKKILSFYYLAFYYSEYKSVSVEEQDYINTKYNFTAISTCIDATLLTDVQAKIDNMATFTVISGAYVNQGPTIGDNTIEVDNRTTTTLTLAMFTSQTTPPYSDPENDPVDALRVDSIDGNNTGKFQVDGVDVTVNQVIDVEVINQGRFTHIGPDQDSIHNDTIGFSLRDTGSMQWVS